MLDTAVTIANGKAAARKCVSGADPFVPGHYPGYPLFPGVLSLSLLTTVCEVLMKHSLGERNFKIIAVEKIRYLAAILPGDIVDVEAEMLKISPEEARVAGTIIGNGGRKVLCQFQIALD